MGKTEEDIINQMLDPEQFTLESIKYQQTLILQHMRIQRIAAGCLEGYAHEQRSKINALYGAVHEMCINLRSSAKPSYLKVIDPFLKINIWEKKFAIELNLIKLFQYIMKIHELNIREYSKYGLKPAKSKALWMATKEDIKKDVLESWKELGVDDDSKSA